jgi:hypothetical protein
VQYELRIRPALKTQIECAQVLDQRRVLPAVVPQMQHPLNDREVTVLDGDAAKPQARLGIVVGHSLLNAGFIQLS